ncbi:MAG: GAF domain-containing protein [Dehalococcoidia bacterium]
MVVQVLTSDGAMSPGRPPSPTTGQGTGQGPLGRAGRLLVPPGSDPAILGPAPFLWLYIVILPLVVLLNRSGGGLVWWALFAVLVGTLAGLAVLFRSVGDGRVRPATLGVAALALLAVALASSLWLATPAHRLLVLLAGLVLIVIAIDARVHGLRTCLTLSALCYAVVLGVTWWSHRFLPPSQALDWWSMTVAVWPLAAVTAGSWRLAQTARQRMEAQRQSVRLSQIDPLTGLGNRSIFLEATQAAVDMAARGGPRCALVLIDLDGLKDINDSFGHGVGDAAIRRIGAIIRAHAGPADVTARFGGDEFGLLTTIPDGVEPASAVAAVTAALEPSPFHDPASGALVVLSASWGIAAWTPGCPDVVSLLAVADEDLIRRKSAPGRPYATGLEGIGAFVPRGRRALAEALASLLDLARDVARVNDGDAFLREMAPRVAEMMGVDRAAFSVSRDDSAPKGYRVTRTAMGWEYGPAVYPGRPSIVDHVYTTGQPYYSNDLSRDPLANPEAVQRWGLSACLCVPLRGVDGRVFGTIFFHNKRGRAPFNDYDVRMAQAFADLAATALEKTEALAAARREAAVSNALVRAVAASQEALEPRMVLQRVMLEVVNLIPANTPGVALVTPEGAVAPVQLGGTEIVTPAVAVRIGEGIIGHVALTGRPYLSNDLGSDPKTRRDVDERHGYLRQIAAPVKGAGGAVIGVITLLRGPDSPPFTDRDLELLEAFTGYAALGLERVRDG